MKVILCEDVPKLGAPGEVKDVSEGFARNFLLPRKLAFAATQANIRKWESEKQIREIRLNQGLETAKKFAEQIGQISINLTAKAGREGHLFGSITNQLIAEALAGKGFSIDKKNIVLEAPIKSLGEYQIAVRLHPQVTASFKIVVVSSEPVANAPVAAPQESTPVQ